MEENIFNSVFTRYGKSLGTPARRGLFLLGSLTQMLLNKQGNVRNTKEPPFRKQLNGLRMDKKDIESLFRKVQSKFMEYSSFDEFKKIEKFRQIVSKATCQYLLEAGDDWRMSVDEINYYFACGMTLTDEIASIVYPKQTDK